MILTLDIGNTRCKWAVSNTQSFVLSGAFLLDDPAALKKMLLAELSDHDCSLESFSDILVASVRDEAQSQIWEKEFKNVSNASVWFAKVESLLDGFRIAYKTTSNLGVDRWLAMLAARKRFDGASIVIDAGSALTIDYINEQGNHDGGLIVPGVSMMSRALFSETHAVKVEQVSLDNDWRPGDDTLPCVSNGISAAFKGLLNEIQQKREAQVVLTGGDAVLLSRMLPSCVNIVEHLVLEGLLAAHEFQSRT